MGYIHIDRNLGETDTIYIEDDFVKFIVLINAILLWLINQKICLKGSLIIHKYNGGQSTGTDASNRKASESCGHLFQSRSIS